MTERDIRGLGLAVGLLCVALVGSGCAFERFVGNAGVQRLDTSSIVVGRSTHVDVILALGLPPTDFPEEIGTYVVAKDYLRYGTLESRCFRIGFEQLFLITPFRWCARNRTYEISVEFDEQGVVSALWETRSGTNWPPFQGADKRGAPRMRDLSAGGKR